MTPTAPRGWLGSSHNWASEPWLGSSLVSTSSQYTKVGSLISGQGTEMSALWNKWLFLSSLSLKNQ